MEDGAAVGARGPGRRNGRLPRRRVRLPAHSRVQTPHRPRPPAPGTTPRAIQAALVPLERVDKRAKVTDAEMGIRTTDDRTAPHQPPSGHLAVVADNIRSAFNAGGLFRTADFFGVERLILCGYTPGPDNPQVKKTALGADETVLWEHAGDIRDVIDRLHAEGYTVYAPETADGLSKWSLAILTQQNGKALIPLRTFHKTIRWTFRSRTRQNYLTGRWLQLSANQISASCTSVSQRTAA